MRYRLVSEELGFGVGCCVDGEGQVRCGAGIWENFERIER